MIFTNIIKPTHLCNLNCKYCYNDDARDSIMQKDTLERVINQTFEYVSNCHKNDFISFIWHGGEPMLATIPFYERVMEIQKRHGHTIKYNNSIQTNGLLIDDKWIKFFKENNFLVSISIDGPQKCHDKLRVDKMGHGSFDRVINAIKKVQESNIPLGVCVVISKVNIDYIEEIYDFLSTLKVNFNIIPINQSGGAKKDYLNLGLEAGEYGDAWIRMYDKWYDANENYTYCSDFVFKTRSIINNRPMDCISHKCCSEKNISVDPDGNVYACATLSGEQNTKYGNIHKQDLFEIMDSQTAKEFRNRSIDPQCEKCKWQKICYGGCLARSYKFYGNYNRRDFYCPSFQKIYNHIDQKLKNKLGVNYKNVLDHI